MALDREKTLQAAQTYVDRKRYDRALAEYQKVIRDDPTDTRTLLKIGDIQARSEQFVDAIETYDKVADYYSGQGFALKAVAVYKQIRELIQRHAPHEADRYVHVADRLVANYTELGLINDALATLDEEATRLRNAGREPQALRLYRRMTEVGAGAPIAHLRLAEALCRGQQVDEAMKSFWAAAQLLIQGGRKDDALRVIERMLHFKQEPTYAKLAARLYLQKGTEEQGMVALSRLQICFQADPKDLETLELLAQAFQMIGQEPKSLEVKKEIARQAYDQGQADLFTKTMAELKAHLPDDDQVKALGQLDPKHAAASKAATTKPASNRPPPSRPASTHPTTPRPPPPPLSSPPAVDSDSDSARSMEINVAAELEALEESGVQSQAMAEAMSEAMSAGEMSGDGLADEMLSEPAPAREEFDSQDLAEVRAHTRKALVDAHTFRDLNLYDKAIETVQVALEFDPRSIELRELLRDLYAETGDRDGAIEEMLTMAAIYVEYERPDHAMTVLENILEAEPGHEVASKMRRRLASSDNTSPPVVQPPPLPTTAPPGPPSMRPSGRPTPIHHIDPMADPRAYAPDPPPSAPPISRPSGSPSSRRKPPPPPLSSSGRPPPSRPGRAAASRPSRSAPSRPAPSRPSASRPVPSRPGQAAPSRPANPPPPSSASQELGELSLDEVPNSAPPESPPELPNFEIESGSRAPSPKSLEEALEEAEFYIASGKFGEARQVLEQQLQRTPNHPLVLEALEELEAAQSETQQDAALAPPPPTDLGSAPGAPRPPMESEFDLEAGLGELQRAVRESQNPPPAGASLDVETVFEKFKDGVKRRVAENDSETHYELGLAYKQMNLLDDAILEFELAAKDPESEAACYAMIGSIYTENEMWAQATKALNRGLSASKKSVEQETDIYYRLGHVAEKTGNAEQASYYFQQVVRRNASYQDAKQRLERVRENWRPSMAPKPQVDDDLDRAFEDLLGD